MELKTFFAQNVDGNVIPGAFVYLYYPGTTDPVTGLEDAAGNPLDNPFQADSDGQIKLAAPNGKYDIHVSSSGRDLRIGVQFFDASEGETLPVSSATGPEPLKRALDQRVIYKQSREELEEMDPNDIAEGQQFNENGTQRAFNSATGKFDPVTPVRVKATDDITGDLNDAMQEVYERGGGNVELPYGTLGWSGQLVVPDGVNLISMGGGSAGTGSSFGSTLKALASDAQIIWGNGSSGGRGGVSIGVVIDGAGIAGSETAPVMHSHLSVQRTFIDFTIVGCAGDALWVDKSQNCTFVSLFAARNQGNAVVLDNGAGGNSFFRSEIAKTKGYACLLRESTGAGPYSSPTHNSFHHSIFERGDDASGKTRGMLKSEAGEQNEYHGCIFSVQPQYSIDGNDAVIQLDGGQVHLHEPRINGGTIHSLVRQEPGAGIFLKGDAKLINSPLAYIYNGGFGSIEHILQAGITTMWGGSGDLNTLYYEISKGLFVENHPGAARLARMRQHGDSTFRIQFKANGGLEWADGNNGPHLDLQPYGNRVLRTSGKLQAQGGFSYGNSDGVSGTFQLSSGETITVQGGIITDIS